MDTDAPRISRKSQGIVMMAVTSLFLMMPILATAQIRDIAFPVEGQVTFRDDFGEPRGSRTHKGIDIHAEKMRPLLSAVDGTVKYVMIPEPSWGYEISIRDDEGYSYNYIHVNNDTPGTDDGNGGPAYAYAPGITHGVRVTRGQHIGWLGDSGNAENIGPHLHFEIETPDGRAIDAFESLVMAYALRSASAPVAPVAPIVPIMPIMAVVDSGTPLATSTDTLATNTPTTIASVSPATPPPTSAPTPVAAPSTRPIFTQRLAIGSKGDEVSRLQRVLKDLGHFDHPSITGYFGRVTAEAVKAFQRANGIDQVGFVGPMTRLALNSATVPQTLD